VLLCLEEQKFEKIVCILIKKTATEIDCSFQEKYSNENYTAKLSPQAQLLLALGLLK